VVAKISGMALTVRVPGLVLTDHEFQIPLDHAYPDSERITVFAREVTDPDGMDRPFLVFLQGGPGQESPRPIRTPTNPGWLDRALRDYRVLLLDQRGTGRSTPVGALPEMSPQQQAQYLTHFRADAIVQDAEWIRAELGVQRWSVLGQSFGGFCALTYLSRAHHGLREVLFTGGVPPIGRHPDEVYRATYTTMLGRNHHYYRRYPTDRDRVLALHERLASRELRLPDGDLLTSRRFRQIGAARIRSMRTSRCLPANTSFPGCSSTTPSWRRYKRQQSCSPIASGRDSSTPSGCGTAKCRARRRSMPRTPTSTARSPRRPHASFPPCGPG
jgi:pimeloyl-ACP methyl ester carboxylesterase